VGSALNDLSREVGGALGTAVIGSIVTAVYRSSLELQLTRLPIYCVAGPTGRRAKNGWCLSSVDIQAHVATFGVAAALGGVGTKALDRLGTLASVRRRATIRA